MIVHLLMEALSRLFDILHATLRTLYQVYHVACLPSTIVLFAVWCLSPPHLPTYLPRQVSADQIVSVFALCLSFSVRQTEGWRDGQTSRQTDRQTEGWRDRQTNRQTDVGCNSFQTYYISMSFKRFNTFCHREHFIIQL